MATVHSRGRHAAIFAGLTTLTAGVLATMPVAPGAAVDTGSISGTVTGFDGGTPVLVDVEVCAWDATTDDCELVGMTSPGEGGSYTLGGLPAGDYKVKFWSYGSGYASEWYDDQPDLTSASTVLVGAGEDVVGIDAELEVAGTISGTVTTLDGIPLEARGWKRASAMTAFVSAPGL